MKYEIIVGDHTKVIQKIERRKSLQLSVLVESGKSFWIT